MAPLLAAAGIDRSIGEQAIHDDLSLDFVPQRATIDRDVRSALPGEVLCATTHCVQLQRYGTPPNVPCETILRKLVDAPPISRAFSGEAFLDRNVTSLRYGSLVLESWIRGEASS